MPLVGFDCTAPNAPDGYICKPQECLERCIDGRGCRPGPYASSLIANGTKYRNPSTVSGSALHQECYGKPVLERLLDYTKPTSDLHWATWRGQNQHDSMERDTRDNELMAHYMVEERFYALLFPDDEIVAAPFLRELAPDSGSDEEGEDDEWIPVKTAVDALKSEGIIVLSGQVDYYYNKEGVIATLGDHKTATRLYGDVKEGWTHQLNLYRLLLELHGYPVKRIEVNASDSAEQRTMYCDLFDLSMWVPQFLIPKARFVQELSEIEDVRDAYEYCNVNFLCSGENRNNKFYCSVRKQCPAWLDWDAAGRPRVKK